MGFLSIELKYTFLQPTTSLIVDFVNLFFLHQRTPLCLAARKGNFDAVKYLGDQGADVNIKDDDGVGE